MIERVRARELRKQSLTDMEFRALLSVSLMDGNATIGRIARWLGRTPHATSALLSRMEKSGLVTRVSDPDNKSKVKILTTDKGQSLYRQGKESESIQRIMSSLPKSKAKRDQLRSDLETIRDAAFKEFGMASKPPLPRAIISDKEG
ncbi:MAG: MarR family transcriptional regulator [Dehalococcoidia bacterium]|nr:MarR family transcriptional regulator [Dehalococcoidia bacterium]